MQAGRHNITLPLGLVSATDFNSMMAKQKKRKEKMTGKKSGSLIVSLLWGETRWMKKKEKKDARSVGRVKKFRCAVQSGSHRVLFQPAARQEDSRLREREGIFFSCFPSFRLEEGGKKKKRKRSLHPEVLCVDSQRPCFAVTS